MAGTEIEDYNDDTVSFNFFNMEQQDKRTDGHIHHQGAEVSKTWILLDNQSTIDVFCNPKLLKNIRKVSVTRTDMVGNLPGYGQVWYNKAGIANILSFLSVNEKYRVTYDVPCAQGKQRGA